jgi:tRNA A37 threonylcarbamoyltransferase TsaD
LFIQTCVVGGQRVFVMRKRGRIVIVGGVAAGRRLQKHVARMKQPRSCCSRGVEPKIDEEAFDEL